MSSIINVIKAYAKVYSDKKKRIDTIAHKSEIDKESRIYKSRLYEQLSLLLNEMQDKHIKCVTVQINPEVYHYLQEVCESLECRVRVINNISRIICIYKVEEVTY